MMESRRYRAWRWLVGDTGNRVWQNAVTFIVLGAPWAILGLLKRPKGFPRIFDWYFSALGLYFSAALTGWFSLYANQRANKKIQYLRNESDVIKEFKNIINEEKVEIILGGDFEALKLKSNGKIAATMFDGNVNTVIRPSSQRKDNGWALLSRELANNKESHLILMDFDEAVYAFSPQTALIIEMDAGEGSLHGLRCNHPELAALLKQLRVDNSGNNRPLARPLPADAYLRAIAESFQFLYSRQAELMQSPEFNIFGDLAVLDVYRKMQEECKNELLALDALSITDWNFSGAWNDIYQNTCKLRKNHPDMTINRLISVPAYELRTSGVLDNKKVEGLRQVHALHVGHGIPIKYMANDMSIFSDWQSTCNGFVLFDDIVILRTQESRMNVDGFGGKIKRDPAWINRHKVFFNSLFEKKVARAEIFDTPDELLKHFGQP